LYAKHLGKGDHAAQPTLIRKEDTVINHLLHLDSPAYVDSFLAFVELLFHSIVRPKPVASGLGSRATPAPVVATGATGANVVDGRVKSWQGIVRVTKAENEGSWNTRTEEAVELGDFIPPTATVFFWGTTI